MLGETILGTSGAILGTSAHMVPWYLKDASWYFGACFWFFGGWDPGLKLLLLAHYCFYASLRATRLKGPDPKGIRIRHYSTLLLPKLPYILYMGSLGRLLGLTAFVRSPRNEASLKTPFRRDPSPRARTERPAQADHMRRESGERKSCGPGSLVQHKVRAEGRRSVAQLVNGFGSHHFPQAVKARGVWLWMLEAKGGWPPTNPLSSSSA